MYVKGSRRYVHISLEIMKRGEKEQKYLASMRKAASVQKRRRSGGIEEEVLKIYGRHGQARRGDAAEATHGMNEPVERRRMAKSAASARSSCRKEVERM